MRAMSSGRHCWTICRGRRSDGWSMPRPSGTTCPRTVAPWLPPVTKIFSGAISSNGGDGSSPPPAVSSRTGVPPPHPRDLLAHGVADQHCLRSIAILQPLDLVIGGADRLGLARQQPVNAAED